MSSPCSLGRFYRLGFSGMLPKTAGLQVPLSLFSLVPELYLWTIVAQLPQNYAPSHKEIQDRQEPRPGFLDDKQEVPCRG